MNIFSVLSTGKSNLHEPSMSSMLAFLLSPTQDHGLGRKFIDGFLELADEQRYGAFIRNDAVRFEIDLEVPYQLGGRRNDIDVQIKVLDKNFKELHRIVIENKIKTGASSPKQLDRYYRAILEDHENDDPFKLEPDKLSIIFLTPALQHRGLVDEYQNLKTENKTWMYWNGEKESLVKLFQRLLEQEACGEISPINEYMRHTLKAFAYYVLNTISVGGSGNRVGEDIGEIKLSAKIEIHNYEYTIVLRDSSQIQLYNQDGDKVVARPLLRSFLEQHGIPEKEGTNTTRTFGSQIFKYLDGQ
ncbi:MAG: PD-(D/E)XK nuclease family protein [Rhodobacteraceae bacterium]|nr:PD-(D/E)XK nuclease family protein [Paracoccaceae bacterium]